jgi:uncharacterized protein (TIGR02145 family)
LKSAFVTAAIFVLCLCRLNSQTVTDMDGNVYQTVTIGTQVWMAENLKTTRFRDGSNIPQVIDSSAWNGARLPGYCWYLNTSLYKDIFGALYNWFAVHSGKLAPTGWHVATDAEWTTLTEFLGGSPSAGGKLKAVGTIEVGTSYWFTPNTNATNTTGFSALGGGARELDGQFNYMFSYGFWWTANAGNDGFAYYRQLSYNYPGIDRGSLNVQDGLSVRCVKDTDQGMEGNGKGKMIRIFTIPAPVMLIVESDEQGPLEVEVFDITGNTLIRKTVTEKKNEIDIGALANGLYIVHVSGRDWQLQRKLIKN